MLYGQNPLVYSKLAFGRINLRVEVVRKLSVLQWTSMSIRLNFTSNKASFRKSKSKITQNSQTEFNHKIRIQNYFNCLSLKTHIIFTRLSQKKRKSQSSSTCMSKIHLMSIELQKKQKWNEEYGKTNLINFRVNESLNVFVSSSITHKNFSSSLD